MKRFAEIESKYKAVHVRGVDDPRLSGVLTLDGRETSVVLSGDHAFRHDTDLNGWFDVVLTTNSGQRVLLHNAVETLRKTRSRNAAAETHIYPNIVAIGDMDQLDSVRYIAFTLTGLANFFHYEHVEWQSASSDAPAIRDALRELRRSNAERFGTGRQHDFFRPSSIYIQHRIPRAFKFRVGDRCYAVGFAGHEKGLGWGRIELQVEPVVEVSFDTVTSLDDALDAVWELRQFFVQVAMQPMPIETIWTRAVPWSTSQAEVYLPGLDEPSPDTGPYGLHPAGIPYNIWSERRQLASVMKAWVAKHDQRRIFRTTLNRVIFSMAERFDVGDVVRLCAALESLSELKPPTEITKVEVRLMAAAAAQAISGKSADLSEERLQSILSTLRRPSLPERFKVLAAHLHPHFNQEDCNLVARLAHQMRNASAHGRRREHFESPLAQHVVVALAAMCTFYDLKTSGMPSRSAHASVACIQRWRQSIGALRNLMPDTTQ